MIIETLASLALAQPVGGPIENNIIKIVDRGRRTPFGRTYDIYLDTDGRVPSFLHAGRTWICDPDNTQGPFDTLGKEFMPAFIEIANVDGNDPLWFNYGNLQAPLSDIRTNGMDAWYWNNDPEWWECKLNDPFDRAYFQPRVATKWIQPGCCPVRTVDQAAQQYWWADTWLVQENVDQIASPNGDPRFPTVYTRDADWIMPNFDGTAKPVRRLEKNAIDEISEWYRCPPSPSSRDSAVLIDFNNDGTDWESDEFPGQFRIMRVTGNIDRISMRFYITYEDLGNPLPGQTTCSEGVNRQDYALSTFVLEDDCPTDLNEDGVTDFNDLMIVISDVSAGRYANDGFEAVLEVLGGWGPC